MGSTLNQWQLMLIKWKWHNEPNKLNNIKQAVANRESGQMYCLYHIQLANSVCHNKRCPEGKLVLITCFSICKLRRPGLSSFILFIFKWMLCESKAEFTLILVEMPLQSDKVIHQLMSRLGNCPFTPCFTILANSHTLTIASYLPQLSLHVTYDVKMYS